MTELLQRIIERIQHEGPISFAAYMHSALYEPGWGYYVSGEDRMGWQGDYFTSTDVSALFASCMGRQLEGMWELLKRPRPFLVLEQGAGRGQLARGVRAWAEHDAPDFCDALDYRLEDLRAGQDARGEAIDAMPGRDWLHCTLPGQGQAQPVPYTIRDAYPAGGDDKDGGMASPSVILSNELIDAFPVHVVEKRGARLYEVYVDAREGRLVETLIEPRNTEFEDYLDRFRVRWRSYDDGWRAEINLDALRWMQRSASLLRRGFALAIDYGERAKVLYSRERKRGTLLCYYRHQFNELPLARPGEQDITAHVNFSALIEEGRRSGLRLRAFMTQRAWLESMGIADEMERLRARDYAASVTKRASDEGQVALMRWYSMRQGVAALMDPAGMGNFKVLIMHR